MRQRRVSGLRRTSLYGGRVWPSSPLAWAAIIALGAASYATPLLSTAFLILAGFARASANVAVAAALIAAKDMIWKPS
ncbi:hypothetical protein J2W51_005092 [Tardiphaga robiniae]|nr:hypothetical protein [Tardiphaga robiniae]